MKLASLAVIVGVVSASFLLGIPGMSGSASASADELCDSKYFNHLKGQTSSRFGEARGTVSRWQRDNGIEYVAMVKDSSVGYTARGRGGNPSSFNQLWDPQVWFKLFTSGGNTLPVTSSAGPFRVGGTGSFDYSSGSDYRQVMFTNSNWVSVDLSITWDNLPSGVRFSALTFYAYIGWGGDISTYPHDLAPCPGAPGSPFVAPWNGTAYALDNNILPASEDFSRADLEVVDYYRLSEPLVPKDGRYSLNILEFEDELTHLDQVRLLAVDHDEDERVVVDSSGVLYSFDDPEPPLRAIDNYGRDVLSSVLAEDATHYQSWRGDFMDIDFGKVPRSRARLVLKADPGHAKQSLDASVRFDGSWQHVDTIHPRIRFAWEVIDFSEYVPSEELTVRLAATTYHSIDFVGLDTSRQRVLSVQEAHLASATHSVQGDVLALVSSDDSSNVTVAPGEHVTLEFGIPESRDDARSFVLVSHGYYTHKYRPYLGEDLMIRGLSVSLAAFLPQRTAVFSWDFDISSLQWVFGDGAVADGWTATHTYTRSGEQLILIRATYEDGSVRSFSRALILP